MEQNPNTLTILSKTAIHILTYDLIRSAIIGDYNVETESVDYFLDTFEHATDAEYNEVYETIKTEISESPAFLIKEQSHLENHLRRFIDYMLYQFDTNRQDIVDMRFYNCYVKAGKARMRQIYEMKARETL